MDVLYGIIRKYLVRLLAGGESSRLFIVPGVW